MFEITSKKCGFAHRRSIKTVVPVAAVMLFGALPVWAQQSPVASTAEAPALEEIVVTGSLIKRPNAETAESITIVKMEAVKDQGVTSVEQALQLVTANNAVVTTASNVGNFNGGASLAALRGFAASKTLVLLDGQRLANNVVNGGAVDLNTIPFAAIDHIEVLKEGASSLYGSDAIAGVINFITKKDYKGGEVNVEFSHPQHPGGSSEEADLTYGIGDLAIDGYNFLIAANYAQQKELTATQRPYATGYNPTLGLENFNGPFGPWPGSYTDANSNLWQTGYPACAGNPHLVATAGSCQYLYSEAVDLIPKSSSESAMLVFTKALGENNTLSIQYLYARSDLVTWGGPQEYGFNMTPATNPAFYPTAANSTCVGTCTTATPDLADGITASWTDPNNNRYFGNINTEQRALLTFTGQKGGWDYGASLNWSVNKGAQTVEGGEANYQIIAPGGTLSNLINPFGPQPAAGQALINSAYINGNLEVSTLSLYGLNGHASHPLGDLFDAGRPAVFAVGFDYRDDQIKAVPTALATTLYAATFYPPNPITGSRVSEAAYMELNVPVASNAEFTISDRQDRYSDFGETNNGKVSFAYQPISILKIRGAASTGFRAPSLVQEYSPQVLAATTNMTGPPCPTGTPTGPFTALNCISQGLALDGGNPGLQPEKSQNFDIGFIIEPIANLGITLDYYRIILKNDIQPVPGQAIYSNPTTFANLYVLNNAGTLTPASVANIQCPIYMAATCGYIIRTEQNTGGITAGGFDVSVNYVDNTDFGRFRVGLEGTFVTNFKFQEYAGGPLLNIVGQFNQGNQPVIRWRHQLNLDWTYQNFGAGLSNNFTEHYHDYNPDAAGNILTVGNFSIFNGYGSFSPIPSVKLLVGINNIADTKPPFSNQPLNFQGSYNPIFSSPLGRTFYGRVAYKF
jgi:iron complex outermembrane receptor protein